MLLTLGICLGLPQFPDLSILFVPEIFVPSITGKWLDILYIERHDFVAKVSLISYECGFLLVGFVHGYLVVPKIGIKEAHYLVSFCVVD